MGCRSGLEIELERIVPLREGIIPLFWVEGGERENIKATLQEDSLTESAEYLTRADDRYLFEIRWVPEVDSLIQPMIESRAEVLRGKGDVNEWEFRLQFDDRPQLAEFREMCQDNDIQIQLDALYNPVMPVEKGGTLTDQQFDVIETAYQRGYWDIPRNVTLGELADLIGISSNACSQRLRRALKTLVGEFLAAKRKRETADTD
ncbi:Predicted DNA binding protein, contains HTH domain [Haladaptatus litoreus]|uniref:Predicted DNA binding protein, contains HTH domain n=1 Tax=Haladaptatus litoreus TaxID=553468 RepID=A0A1N7DAD5_9EURY|nr:helix-turn-helix domain-containing protein [Haladaptatus litoreus]SIR72799.1 Predicted DNA binding protein, contains HTH domain [Haladaptatus litoreus]